MNSNNWLELIARDTAALPEAWSAQWAQQGLWALVLAAGLMALTRHLKPAIRWVLVGAAVALTLWPGVSSPAYWLGLAFQSPSLMSGLICARLLINALPGQGWVDPVLGGVGREWLLGASVAGLVLGWVLLLDTLAWWPVSVYAWGFGSISVAALLLPLVIGWVVWGARESSRLVLACYALALALFAITRGATGNVWDALIDPWLWVALHGLVLIHLRRWWRQRASPTIQV